MKRASRVRTRASSTSEPPPRVVVMAAGVGSRMRSSRPKVLHRIGGRTLLDSVLSAAEGLAPSKIVVVVGSGRDEVESALSGRPVELVTQDPPRGTGDAARRAHERLGDGGGPVLILAGDTPLLRTETLRRLIEHRRRERLDLAFLSFRPPEPGQFGRVVRDGRGRVARIVEASNAGPRERAIREVNASVYCFSPEPLARALAKLRRDAGSGEVYLTDAVQILISSKGRVDALEAADWREAWGVNTRRDLADAEEMERRRSVEEALERGVTILDPATVRLGPRVRLSPDVILHPFVSLEGATSVGERAEILPFTRIVDGEIAAGARVGPHCEVESARVGPDATVGPFARLRPGTDVQERAHVGTFVELKNTTLRKGAKAPHLTYLGDAEVGAGSNIGAGVITCNYDGEKKHRTTIGENVFVGSDTQLVAPVTVGKGAYVGAGSTITDDVPEGALALSRVPQINKEGWVQRRKEKRTPKE